MHKYWSIISVKFRKQVPITEAMKDEFKKTKLIAAALSTFVAVVCFSFGAIWVRSLHDAVDQSRLDDAGREIRGRMLVIKQLVVADMAALNLDTFTSKKLPDVFDVGVLYRENRMFVTGFQRVGKNRTVVQLNQQLLGTAIPGDSSFFDRAASEGAAAGLLVFEGRPLMVAVKRLSEGSDQRSFILAGRWLDPRKLAPTAGLSELAFDLFVPDDRSSLPSDVEAARTAMKSDVQFFGRLQRRGAGVGYLKFDDVLERTAFILRFPWIDGGINGERHSLFWLLITSLLVGLVLYISTSFSLSAIERQRRRTPGLSGMTERELRDLIESFPGYAFALNERGAYVAVSRPLSGVSGKESVYFTGRLFGSVSGEIGINPLEVMSELASSNQWPATKVIAFSIAGLKDQFSYSGSCHFVSANRILFVILQPDERAYLQRVVDQARESAGPSPHQQSNVGEDVAA